MGKHDAKSKYGISVFKKAENTVIPSESASVETEEKPLGYRMARRAAQAAQAAQPGQTVQAAQAAQPVQTENTGANPGTASAQPAVYGSSPALTETQGMQQGYRTGMRSQRYRAAASAAGVEAAKAGNAAPDDVNNRDDLQAEMERLRMQFAASEAGAGEAGTDAPLQAYTTPAQSAAAEASDIRSGYGADANSQKYSGYLDEDERKQMERLAELEEKMHHGMTSTIFTVIVLIIVSAMYYAFILR